MRAFERINVLMLKMETFHEAIAPIFINHIIPELRNEQPILQDRALHVLARYSRLNFDNDHCLSMAKEMYDLLESDNLCVKVSAACSFYLYLRKDVVREAMKEVLPNLLEKYLEIMEEIDHEELVQALEELVGSYKDDIAPFAIQLTKKLVENYKKIVSSITDEEGQWGEASMTAACSIQAIK